MASEGGLRAPERQKFDIESKIYWDESVLDKEMRRQFDVCHSCRRCFNLCDSFPKLFDIIDESESMELDTVSSKEFQKVTDACTLCDMCFMVSCPYVPPHEFAIDIPSLFIRHKAQNNKLVKSKDKLLSKTDINGKIGIALSKVSNFLTAKSNIIFRFLMEIMVGIDKSASLPKFNKSTFQNYFKNITKKVSFQKHKNQDKVVIFSTCYVNYNDANIGKALIKVLEKNKVYYEEGYTECCKMPQLEQGDVKSVKVSAEKTAKIFRSKIDEGYKVIAPIASCALMLKSHWPLISPEDENVKLLAENTLDVDEFVWDLNNKNKLNKNFQPLNKNITLHTSCHSRAQNIGPKSAQILSLIPGNKTMNVEKCSGHGGTWGIKKKWNKTARKVGLNAAKLLYKEDNLLASTCPLAALHLNDINEEKKIEKTNKKKIYHPIELIAKAYEDDNPNV
jgi:glycerol-3-phosphate dehydrogenase subunit C